MRVGLDPLVEIIVLGCAMLYPTYRLVSGGSMSLKPLMELIIYRCPHICLATPGKSAEEWCDSTTESSAVIR